MNKEEPVPFKQYFPNLSLNAYFWIVILVCGVVFGICGYFVGIRVNELPSSSPSVASQQTQASITSPNGDNDSNAFQVSGIFTTGTSFYQQFVIYIDSLQNGVRTHLDDDTRFITKPQVGVQYPFLFSRLDPLKTYIVWASACTVNPKTYVLECARHIKMTGCSGRVQGSSCIFKGNGNNSVGSGVVNYSIAKADNTIPKSSVKKQ